MFSNILIIWILVYSIAKFKENYINIKSTKLHCALPHYFTLFKGKYWMLILNKYVILYKNKIFSVVYIWLNSFDLFLAVSWSQILWLIELFSAWCIQSTNLVGCYLCLYFSRIIANFASLASKEGSLKAILKGLSIGSIAKNYIFKKQKLYKATKARHIKYFTGLLALNSVSFQGNQQLLTTCIALWINKHGNHRSYVKLLNAESMEFSFLSCTWNRRYGAANWRTSVAYL